MANTIKKWDEVHGTDESEKKMSAFLESTTDSYAVLQLRRDEETLRERFLSYDGLKQQGMEPDIDHYEVVYTGSLSTNLTTPDMFVEQLESLYEKFNIEQPKDFTGHSLSVSDIVALKVGGVVSSHYVDTMGFRELPDFIRESNYLKNAEMAMEDDYNSLDGIINNGSKEELVPRKSIIEQLKDKTETEPMPPLCIKPEEREL